MNRTIEMVLPVPVQPAANQAARALASLGKVRKSTLNDLEGTVTYGFQQVKVRISWTPDPEGTRLLLQGSSDDLWGAGARSALTRLEATIRNLDVPGYQVDRLGMHPAALVGMLIGFILLLLWLVPVLFLRT
jgi:hypothetical protein